MRDRCRQPLCYRYWSRVYNRNGTADNVAYTVDMSPRPKVSSVYDVNKAKVKRRSCVNKERHVGARVAVTAAAMSALRRVLSLRRNLLRRRALRCCFFGVVGVDGIELDFANAVYGRGAVEVAVAGVFYEDGRVAGTATVIFGKGKGGHENPFCGLVVKGMAMVSSPVPLGVA